MNRPSLVTLLAVSCLALAGCNDVQRPSNPLRWESGDRIRVPHPVHKANDVECISCHEEVFESKELTKSILPKEEKCMECHQEWKDQNQCSKCHSDVGNAGVRAERPRGLKINHVAHLERVKEDCSQCHKKLSDRSTVTSSPPPMSACLACHNHKQEFKEGRCDVCHVSLTQYAEKPRSFFSHEGDFLRRHKMVARSQGAQCATCHEQTFCSDCHSANTVALRPELLRMDRVESGFIHRGDFQARHPVEASADPASCMRCHGTSFCSACHTANNITPAGTDPRNPHPPGYAFPGNATFHGGEARRDIVRCAACHDQGAASSCVECHKEGGVGGNPHPAGWALLHDRQEIRLNSMCMYCHR